METHLRPMSLGEILDRTAQLYRSNFLLFAGIASVYAGALMVLGLVQIGLQQLFLTRHWTQQMVWLTVGAFVVQFVVSFVVGGLAVAANNRAVAWVHLGQRATIRGAYKSVLPRLRPFLWLMTIITFVLWTPLGIGYGGFAALMYWYIPKVSGGKAHPQDPQTTLYFGMLFLLLLAYLAAALLYGVLMSLRYALAIPAWIVEELKARPALRRSIDLTRGSRGRIFLLGLLVVVIQLALVGITQGFFVIFAMNAIRHHMTLPIWMRISQQIVGFATSSFIGPMYAIGLTLFYYDQRVRKEGFDIEWMMQAAGLTAAPAEIAAGAAEAEPIHAEPMPPAAANAETETKEAPAPGEPL